MKVKPWMVVIVLILCMVAMLTMFYREATSFAVAQTQSLKNVSMASAQMGYQACQSNKTWAAVSNEIEAIFAIVQARKK